MKKPILLLLVSTCFLNFLVSQNQIPQQVEVKFDDSVEDPEDMQRAPSLLQSIYTTYDVYSITQKYPQASQFNHPLADSILRVYDVNCYCDEELLLSELLGSGSSLIDGAYLCYEPTLLEAPPPFIPNDPEDASWNMWRLENINAYEAWEITKGDPNIKIGISDKWYDIDHPDLVNKILFTSPGIILSDQDHDHGTLVASSAACETNNGIGHSSIGFNCSLLLYQSNLGDVLDAALAGASVINMSWFYDCSPNDNHHNIVKMVTDLGVVLVAAAGNGNVGDINNIIASCGGSANDYNLPVYPPSYPEIIQVSGTGINNCLEFDGQCWGDYTNPSFRHFTQNDGVDVLAAGMCVRGAVNNNGYDWGIGTSFASPIVSGVVGLMLSLDPCLEPSEILSILTTTDQDVYDESVCSNLNSPDENNMPGVGLVDAYAAVLEAQDAGTEYHIHDGQTVVWNNQVIDDAKDIYVHSGGTLIIRNGSEISIKKDKRIIVEREAKLYIDNSTIKSKCEKYFSSWDGIFVHGNAAIEQPAIDPDDLSTVLSHSFLTDESGIVVITNGSFIKNSRIGVSTIAPGYEYSEQIARWGGLVLIDHTTFQNVKTSVQFMKYDLPNKSRIVYSTFTKDPSYDVLASGITAWGCNGITIENNVFEYMTSAGVKTFDFYGSISNNNHFNYCERGIESYSTAPLQSGLIINNNMFLENKEHILAQGVNEAIGLEITNNDFNSAHLDAIWIDAPSNYRIRNNQFEDNGLIDIVAINTSDKRSIIHNNTFDSGIYGIVYVDDNKRSRFENNCFTKEESDVYLTSIQSGLGTINYFQGSPTIPAGNCFSVVEQQIDASSSEADFFLYFIPQSGDTNLDECNGFFIPDVGSNNYDILAAIEDVETFCTIIPGPIAHPDYTLEDLDDKLGHKEDIIDLLAINPTSLNLKFKLEEVIDSIDEIESSLEISALSVQDFDEAELIYQNRGDIKSLKSLYGLKFNQGDFHGADSVLNLIPTNTLDGELFVQIQGINIERMIDTLFELSNTDKEFLHDVAIGNSSVRGYAGALYNLLTGEGVYPELPLLLEQRSTNENSFEETIKSLRLYPNPANNFIKIDLDYKSTFTGYVTVFDLLGKALNSYPVNNENTQYDIPTGDLASGIYFIKFTNSHSSETESNPVYRIVVQH